MADLQIVCWGSPANKGALHGNTVQMAHSVARGRGLVSNGYLGADIVFVPAGEGFVPHTHPGHHILLILYGRGTITFDGKVYLTNPGVCYMIDGSVPHGVGAIDDHSFIAVGAPHRPVDSPDRMVPVEYEAVLSEIGDMECLICSVKATSPTRLHDLGCKHCPGSCCIHVEEPHGARV